MYGIWRSCERLGVRPPGVKDSFEECSGYIKNHLLAYNDIRSYEEAQKEINLMKTIAAAMGATPH